MHHFNLNNPATRVVLMATCVHNFKRLWGGGGEGEVMRGVFTVVLGFFCTYGGGGELFDGGGGGVGSGDGGGCGGGVGSGGGGGCGGGVGCSSIKSGGKHWLTNQSVETPTYHLYNKNKNNKSIKSFF